MDYKSLFLVGVLFLSACATHAKYDAKLNQMVGQTKAYLISQMGQPTSVRELANGEEVITFVYSNQRIIPEPNFYYDTGMLDEDEEFYSFTYGGDEIPDGTLMGETIDDYCKTRFYLKNKVVVSWQWKGNACVAI